MAGRRRQSRGTAGTARASHLPPRSLGTEQSRASSHLNFGKKGKWNRQHLPVPEGSTSARPGGAFTNQLRFLIDQSCHG